MPKDKVISFTEVGDVALSVGHSSPHFHKVCAHRLHAVLFISVTFNTTMAMEEIKLTQNVHNEALSADVSGMVQSLNCTLKRQKPSFLLCFQCTKVPGFNHK